MTGDLSRDEAQEYGRSDDVPAPYEVPAYWTAGHVAHRLVHAFDVLMATSGRIAPTSYGSAWPTSLKEFSDLIDEQSMKAARDAFAENFRRPTAEEISMSDEALTWPLRYAAHEPMACDAVLLWAMCKAGGFSIARVLRERTVKAKTIAERMAAAEHQKAKTALLDEAKTLLARIGKSESSVDSDTAERAADLQARIKGLQKPIVLPWQAMPQKILSRTTLDRYLPAGLSYLAEQLHSAHVPVR